jgi:hypothetical protein
MRSTAFVLPRSPHPFVPLLVGLLVFHVASPLLGQRPVVSLFLTFLLLWTSVPALEPTRRVRAAAIAGLMLVIIVRVASLWRGGENTALNIAALLATAAYVAFVAGHVLVAVVRPARVTANTIVGAICVYLLLAQVFGLVYFALEMHSPGAIVGAGLQPDVADGQPHLYFHQFLYFSVITLTTLGYGDIMPASPVARSLVMLEAMLGQFFLAVFVARFVGALGPPRPPSDGAAEGSRDKGSVI